MDFLKKHYEKIILSLVLLGLAAAAAMMPVQLARERERLNDQKQQWFGNNVNKLKPNDLATNATVLERAKAASDIDLAEQHNVFNPVKWLRRPDGGLVKVQTGDEVGASAVVVSNIFPLRFVLSYRVPDIDADPIRYEVSALNEAEKPAPNKRLMAQGQTARFAPGLEIQLKEVIGEPKSPTALVMLINNEREPVRVEKAKTHERIVGYAADLFYPPGNRNRPNVRKGNSVQFGDETYNIVAINEREVVLSAQSNQKQTVRRFEPNVQGLRK